MAVAMPSSRNPLDGLSWEEEVVPALRKRLESESRTLSKRMSGISLSSTDLSTVPSPSTPKDVRKEAAYYSQDPRDYAEASRSRSTTYDSQASSERTTAAGSSSRTNGIPSQQAGKKKPPIQSQPSHPRSRTVSQPFSSHSESLSRPSTGYRGKVNGNADIRPTRIPKASRTASGHSPPIPQTNGTAYTIANPYKVPELPAHLQGGSSKNSSQSQVNLPDRRDPHLLNEPAPFQPGSTTSLAHDDYDDGAPVRASMESEERPFQHWYRGDVSRNGGIGEIRIGRRQEMLDIANYGHKIREQERAAAAAKRSVSHNYLQDQPRRQRADSFSRLQDKEQRDSLYLDDQQADNVLDENPLTDIDNVSEDVASASENHGSYAYHHERDNDPTVTGNEDLTITTSTTPMTWSASNTTEGRSTTPTFSSNQSHGHRRSSSSRQREPSSSRIPQPASRRGSDARATTPTPTLGMGRTSPGPTASNMAASTSSLGARQRQPSISTTRSTGTTAANSANSAKRGRVPNASAPSKAKPKPSKQPRSKTMPPKIDPKNEKDRRSVAYYPNIGDDSELMDAIPSWTQPVPKSGNWDEVVLPVVARKQGLSDQFHTAVGKPKPRRLDEEVEPAPGTFAYDDSKGRKRQPGEPETIPMDEFGRPMYPPDSEDEGQEVTVPPETSQRQQNGARPTRTEPPPSPAPFSQYGPGVEKKFTADNADARLAEIQRQQREDQEDTGGCCKCIIM